MISHHLIYTAESAIMLRCRGGCMQCNLHVGGLSGALVDQSIVLTSQQSQNNSQFIFIPTEATVVAAPAHVHY